METEWSSPAAEPPHWRRLSGVHEESDLKPAVRGTPFRPEEEAGTRAGDRVKTLAKKSGGRGKPLNTVSVWAHSHVKPPYRSNTFLARAGAIGVVKWVIISRRRIWPNGSSLELSRFRRWLVAG